jgi:hypothetical protein
MKPTDFGCRPPQRVKKQVLARIDFWDRSMGSLIVFFESVVIGGFTIPSNPHKSSRIIFAKKGFAMLSMVAS